VSTGGLLVLGLVAARGNMMRLAVALLLTLRAEPEPSNARTGFRVTRDRSAPSASLTFC
jgi:hypothetical protein